MEKPLVRIRYKKIAGSAQTEVSKPIVAGLDILTVTLDLRLNKYTIVNQGGITKAQGNDITKKDMLPKIKADLVRLGIKFADEVRIRKPKVDPNQGEELNDSSNDVVSNAVLVKRVRTQSEDGYGGGGDRVEI